MIHFQLRSRYIWYSFFSFYHSHFSLGVMDRQGISSSVYNNSDEFDATSNSNDAKMHAQMEEIKALISSYKRSSSSSRRRSRAHASELPSPARSHRHRHHHHHEHEGQELNTNNRSTTSPSSLASSPFTSRHLRLWIYGILAHKHLKTTLKRSSPSSSPRLPRATTTSTSTTRFLYMGL